MLCYCTNVHAGATLTTALDALELHACAVRRSLVDSRDLGPDESLGVGWWLSAEAARDLIAEGRATFERVAAFLNERGLAPITFNGFPFGDFHEERVKHRVYEPDWTMPQRRAYTLALAEIAASVARVTPARREFSISTVPIGWPAGRDEESRLVSAAEALVETAGVLRGLRDRTGVRVHVDLEPEPGCLIQRSGDLVAFFDRFLRAAAARRGLSDTALRDHIGVCHDVCHAAVMFEPQDAALRRYAAAGISVGKMQLSAAPCVDFDALPSGADALERLRAFVEPRYLHQTMIRMPAAAGESAPMRFYEDLELALRSVADGPRGEWRVHFHVPIFLNALEERGRDDGASPPALRTTAPEIAVALTTAASDGAIPTLEVETYAWNVLPHSMRPASLAEGIAQELRSARRSVEAAMRGVLT